VFLANMMDRGIDITNEAILSEHAYKMIPHQKYHIPFLLSCVEMGLCTDGLSGNAKDDVCSFAFSAMASMLLLDAALEAARTRHDTLPTKSRKYSRRKQTRSS
jgi:hypothetical protein